MLDLIEHDRHQCRPHIVCEIGLYKSAMSEGQLGFVYDKYLLTAQLLLYLLIGLFKLKVLLDHDLLYLIEQLLWLDMESGLSLLAKLHHALQGSHTHPKEFIQIVGENTQEFQPVENGHGLVLRLLEHPVIKGQPAYLPVYKLYIFRHITLYRNHQI